MTGICQIPSEADGPLSAPEGDIGNVMRRWREWVKAVS